MAEKDLYLEEREFVRLHGRQSPDVRRERVTRFLQNNHKKWFEQHPEDQTAVIGLLEQLAVGIEQIIGERNPHNIFPLIIKQGLEEMKTEQGKSLYATVVEDLKKHNFMHVTPLLESNTERSGFIQTYRDIYGTDYLSMRGRDQAATATRRNLASVQAHRQSRR